MKNTSFKRLWTKTSIRRILKEFEVSGARFLCCGSAEFEKIWLVHYREIEKLARNFRPDCYSTDDNSDHYALFPFNRVITEWHDIRCQFLKHEINRLTNN